MNLQDFFKAVEADGGLEGVTVVEKPPSFVVACISNGYKTKLPFETVEQCEWADMRAVMLGERPPEPITHISRIVGYYSRIENWNPSKVGELKDRHEGAYSIAE